MTVLLKRFEFSEAVHIVSVHQIKTFGLPEQRPSKGKRSAERTQPTVSIVSRANQNYFFFAAFLAADFFAGALAAAFFAAAFLAM